MHYVTRVLGLLTVSVLPGMFILDQQVPARHALGLTPPIERFDGDAAWRTRPGVLHRIHVVIQDWGIHGRQSIKRFPVQGMVVVELRAGRVTTLINGKEEKRSTGEFWTVPAGSWMSVDVTSEAATLQTMAIRPR